MSKLEGIMLVPFLPDDMRCDLVYSSWVWIKIMAFNQIHAIHFIIPNSRNESFR